MTGIEHNDPFVPGDDGRPHTTSNRSGGVQGGISNGEHILFRVAFKPTATIMTSQVPVNKWHDTIGDPTLADAILDRLIHNAYRVNLKGESMRKRHAKLTTTAPSV